MPIIRIDYDNEILHKEAIILLSQATQKIVSEATGIEDVFVYANSAEIKINIAPIEIFVQMSAHIIADEDTLIKDIREKLTQWKHDNNFLHPLNLTIIPMKRKIEVNI